MRARVLPAIAGLTVILAPSRAIAEVPLPALVVAADGGVGGRALKYRDDLFDTLRPYRLGAAPYFGGEIAVYPGAFVTHGLPAWLGVHARAEGLPGLRSRRSEHDDALPTRAWALAVTARLRAPLRIGAAWVEAGAAARTFTLDRAGITEPDVPSVRYLGPRFGLGLEIALPIGLTLAPRGAATIWTSAGDIASAAWFPRARAFGVDVGLRLSWSLPRGFAPYLDIAWTRQILGLYPEPGDARVAGGAADDWGGARLGVAWTRRR